MEPRVPIAGRPVVDSQPGKFLAQAVLGPGSTLTVASKAIVALYRQMKQNHARFI